MNHNSDYLTRLSADENTWFLLMDNVMHAW